MKGDIDMKRLLCTVLIGLVGLIGCAGVNGGNKQTGGDDMLNRPPNVQFQGTGIEDPNSEL
jgi:hypothetical protein